MKSELINDIYSKQTVTLTDNTTPNILLEGAFHKACEELETTYKDKISEPDYIGKSVKEEELTIMFFNRNQPESLYKDLTVLMSKNKKRCYLDDISVGLVDLTELKLLPKQRKYITKNNSAVLTHIALTSSLLSETGVIFKDYMLLGSNSTTNSTSVKERQGSATNEINNIETEEVDKSTDEALDAERARTLESLLDAHKVTTKESEDVTSLPSTEATNESTTVPTFAKEPTSLTEVTAYASEKVQAGISTLATLTDSLTGKQNMYIINEKQCLTETHVVSIFHIYVNKKLVASVIPEEFSAIILAIQSRGQIHIREIETIVTMKGEWEPTLNL